MAANASSAEPATDPFSHFDLPSMSKGDTYKLLTSVVMPRPIAWVTSHDHEGTLNAAPYSFFNVLSSDPPLLAVSFSSAPDREGKDSLFNIRQTGELVVNMVSEEVADAMNITAVNAPRGTDETRLAGLTLVPSAVVGVPRIAEAPASMECQVYQVVELGNSSAIVLAKVVYVHVRTSAFENVERLHVDAVRLRLIGRMHGGNGGYCTTRETFTIERPKWPTGKGTARP